MAIDKKGMDMCDSCKGGMGCGCGHCDYHMMGRHQGVARTLLCFAIVAFVFLIGLALGEIRAYISEWRYDTYYGQIYSGGQMLTPRVPRAASGGYAAPSPSPSPSGKR